MSDIEIDEIHRAIDALIKAECWSFLDRLLLDKQQNINRIDIDEIMSYATATLPVKSKLFSRKEYLRKAILWHGNQNGMWEGLE